MAHCLRHIIRDEKNDAIVHILLRIIDRFFEKALDQYYSQLSEAGQLDQKKDQTRKYKWKDKQKSIKFCLLKRMAEYEKKYTNGILPCCCDFWIQKNQANKKVVR